MVADAPGWWGDRRGRGPGGARLPRGRTDHLLRNPASSGLPRAYRTRVRPHSATPVPHPNEVDDDAAAITIGEIAQ